MLHARTLLGRDGLTVSDVACHHRAGRGAAGEQTRGWALVLVRRGCFARTADGAHTVLDPTMAYTLRPGEEERYDHPHDAGDDCTSIGLSEELVASLRGGDGLPAGALAVDGAADVRHRLLLSSLERREDPDDAWERAVGLCASVLERVDAARPSSASASRRPATRATRRALVDGAREALAADHDLSLLDLARTLGTSPHHLSRVFCAATGHSVARHRMRLRTRSALERLAGGETDLARLAFETGFADQSHLTRVVKDETGGATPAALRAALHG